MCNFHALSAPSVHGETGKNTIHQTRTDLYLTSALTFDYQINLQARAVYVHDR